MNECPICGSDKVFKKVKHREFPNSSVIVCDDCKHGRTDYTGIYKSNDQFVTNKKRAVAYSK